MSHMNIKRIVHRSMEELRASMDIANNFSIKDAYIVLKAKVYIQLLSRGKQTENSKIIDTLNKKHRIMLKYTNQKMSSFLKDYKWKPNLIDVDERYQGKIWVCWWQGINEAPEIVKRCVESIEKNSGNHEVIIITDENYKKFVNFPEWLFEKKDKGVISRTHFSDLLRTEVLSNYGGVWLDSTFFCTANIDDLFNLPIWTIKRPNYGYSSVACGQFANYSLGCDLEHRRFFGILRDFIIGYWKDNNEIIDYLLTDYFISLILKYDKESRTLFNSIKPNNSECDELFKVLGKKYDELKWMKMKEHTCLFKLSWKYEFPKSIDDISTFFGKLLNFEL